MSLRLLLSLVFLWSVSVCDARSPGDEEAQRLGGGERPWTRSTPGAIDLVRSAYLPPCWR